MQGSAWVDLLGRMPAELHDSLALGLVTGEEVVVQQFIRMEDDFVIVRGRIAGTTAEGRIMVVPFSHMSVLAFNKSLTEPEIQAIFGKAPPATAAPAPGSSALPAAESTPPLPAALGKQTPPPGASLPGSGINGQPKPPPPSKSVLLARLRQRLAEKSK